MTNLLYALRDMAKSQQNSRGFLSQLNCDWDMVFGGSELDLLTRRPPLVAWAVRKMKELNANDPAEVDRWCDDGGQ